MATLHDKSILELAREHDERVAQFSKRKRANSRRAWPMESDALACMPNQVDEFRDFARGSGLTGVDFKPDGTCVVSTPGQRRQYLRLRGLFDRDGNDSPRNL